ncbi:hypothetical protein ACS0TY_029150 [Phlomoides rotata]
MVSPALYFFLVLIIHPTTGAEPPAYTPTDLILLICGDSSNLKDGNRTWKGDDGSRYAPPNAAAISTAAAAYSPPDHTVFARVFHSPFTYTFPLLSGQKFLRLYFFLADYYNFDASQSFFNVTANGFTLLANFSAFIYSKNSSQPYVRKEFIINIGDNQKLELTFTPIPNSSAFVNLIEIVSIPDKLYFKGNDVPIKFVDQQFYLNNSIALENIYRLNVGGNTVDIQDDSGMFRSWISDVDFAYHGDPGRTPLASDLPINYTKDTPPYSAPEIVYTTCIVMSYKGKSLDWYLPVDSGFHYLLRLHFCEFFPEVTKQNQRVFTISVNNQTEEIKADVISWTRKDYITWVPDDGRRGRQDLRLSLFPNLEGSPMYSSALLNGLEIFKLSDKNRSLAAANPELKTQTGAALQNRSGRPSVIYAVIGSVMGILTVVAAVGFLVFKRQRRKKNSVPRIATMRSTGSGLPFDFCRYFSFNEIKTATSNFSDNFIIGKGGFGDVYKGLIDNSSTTVAIKRLNPSSKQGAREFFTEIEMLSKLRYVHLVSLIGYCKEYGEMILVYDYMAFGTLRDHLYNTENPPLTCKQRLRICQGAAKGLQYLHAGTNQAIIHRDVKSTNILLNEKWVAKISDFGISKVGPTGGAQTHVSTAVKGSFGYLDPEYYRWQQLTEKSDVYSFGVVLLEVLCARPALNPSLPQEQANLAEWAKSCVKEGTFKQIIDSTLDGQIAQESVNKFVETAMACLKEKGVDRPTMSDVVRNLEFAIQLQEAAEDRKGSTAGADGDADTSPLLATFFRSRETAESMAIELSIASCKKLMAEDVFTEIKNPAGR